MRFTSPNAGLSVSNWNSLARLPLAIQRRNRLYTASQAPNSAGRSLQGTPVRPIYNTASKNWRSGNTGGCPHLYRLACLTHGPMTVQRSSVIMYRMPSEPRRVTGIPFPIAKVYPETARIVNST